MARLFKFIRNLFRRERVERDLDAEIRSYLDQLTEEKIASGMNPGPARRAARLELGGAEQVKEQVRDARSGAWLDSLWQDVRFGARMLRRSPGFTAVTLLTLALGIGANTAIFSIVNAVFLRPLAFRQAGRIYVVKRVDNQLGGSTISFPIFLAWQERAEGLFDHLALAAWWGDATLAGAGESERIPIAGASTTLFSVLGVRPALGRDFLPEEGRLGGPNVVILSDNLWRNRFGADGNIIGRTATIDGEAHSIVGVLPERFELPIPGMRNAQLWLPIRVPRTSNNAANGTLLCLGLLKKDVNPAQASAALTPPLSDLRSKFPKMFGPSERAHLEPLRNYLAGSAGPAPLLLLGAVGLVLLLACANVANLTLARSATRRREMAIRAALGAGRTRVIRQLLTESVLIAMLGGTLGVLVCYASFDFILALVPVNLPHVGAFRMDWSVLLFALALSAFTGVVFGLAPAITASRVDLSGSLKESGPRASAEGHSRLRSVLAAGEVSISLVLLIGATLSLESFVLLLRVEPGFDPHNLLTFNISQRPKDFGPIENRMAFYDRAMDRLRALPDVEQVALINVLPFQGGNDILFSIEGDSGRKRPENVLDADFRVVSPDFFQALRIPFLRGRGFSKSDSAGGAPVVIINQAMARSFWSDQDPIGQRIWIGKPMGPEWTEPEPREIVGIVGNIHGASLADAPNPTMYLPYSQRPLVQANFVVRTRLASLATVPEIRNAMREVDASLPLAQVKTMEQVLSASVTHWRFRSVLLLLFAAVAVLIAAVGVYGVISNSVAQRTHEIGIRMALGARREDVLKLVVGQGLKLTLMGVAIGIAGALALTRFLSSLLCGITPSDPWTFIGVSLFLTAVVLVAIYIPAFRATRIDPMVALRYE